MLEDTQIGFAPTIPMMDDFREGARPFGGHAMTKPRQQDVADATREVSTAFTGTPTRPIKTMAELQAWVDAADAWTYEENARRIAAAEKWKAEQIQRLYHEPFGVFGI